MIEGAVTTIGGIGLEAQVQLIQQALSSLSGSVEQKLGAIQTVLESQGTSLSSKIGLIESAVTNGFADGKTAIGLLQTALGALKTQVGGTDESLSKKIDEVLADLGTLSTSLTTGQIAQALAQILAAVQGQTDYSQTLADIKKALEDLKNQATKMPMADKGLDDSTLNLTD